MLSNNAYTLDKTQVQENIQYTNTLSFGGMNESISRVLWSTSEYIFYKCPDINFVKE
jgi:hypothetical protein